MESDVGRGLGRGLTRRDFLLAGAGAGLFFLGPGTLLPGGGAGAAPVDLEIFTAGYPRAFFFRQTEYEARVGDLPYAEWEKRYLPLGGIMGKVLNEEHDFSRKNNLSFFKQYKANNPGKAVFLHYNGTGRRPTDAATTEFFAGHWLYYRGTRLTRRAGGGANVLRVGDTSVFKMSRSQGVADDIAITVVDGNGRPIWDKAEQVRLRGMNPREGTITVQRGAYGTPRRYFPAGSYLAAHVVVGPYNQAGITGEDIALWAYNFSTVGPRDARGRTGGEALADYLVEKLGPGGELASFDGVTLDIFNFALHRKEADANADGRKDGGVVGGVDVWGLGTLRFTQSLRRRLPDKIIMSDGQDTETSQRSFGHLNGIESEGYPNLYDAGLEGISKGENVFDFWRENGTAPSMNYINFKYKTTTLPREPRNEFVEPNLSRDDGYRKVRLALASAQFADAVFSNAGDWGTDGVWAPPETLWRQENAGVQVFDELWQGTDQKPNWLGMPLGPTVLLAGESPDLLRGQGETWPGDFVGRFRGEGVAFARRRSGAPGISVRAVGSVARRDMAFGLPGLRVTGRDLFVSLRLKADPLGPYPAPVARGLRATAAPDGGRVRAGSFTWANGKPFAAKFYFRDVGPGPVDLGFVVEGRRPVYFEELTARSAADGRFREFENGVVFANNSNRPYTFDLGALLPGASLRRIRGVENQDPETNDGRSLGATLTLPPRDALFAVRSVP